MDDLLLDAGELQMGIEEHIGVEVVLTQEGQMIQIRIFVELAEDVILFVDFSKVKRVVDQSKHLLDEGFEAFVDLVAQLAKLIEEGLDSRTVEEDSVTFEGLLEFVEELLSADFLVTEIMLLEANLAKWITAIEYI